MIQHPGQRRGITRLSIIGQRLRIPVLLLICVLGAALSLLIARQTAQSNRKLLELAFEDNANDSLMAVSHAINQSMEQVRTLAAFLRADQHVSRGDFARFVLPALRRHPTLTSMAWIPVVPASNRETFEKAMTAGVGAPIHITQFGADGEPTPAKARTVYYPVAFAEPLDKVKSTLGYDEGSDSRRLDALTRAGETGRLVITPPVVLDYQGSPRLGVVAFAPIYRDDGPATATSGVATSGVATSVAMSAKTDTPITPPDTSTDQAARKLIGFAAAQCLISDVIVNSLSNWKQPDLQVYLFDTSLPEGKQLLYQRFGNGILSGGNSITVKEATDKPRLSAVHHFVVGTRQWLLVATPTPTYLAHTPGLEPWVVGLIGLAITGLVTAILGGVIFYSDRIAAFAAEREAANAELRERVREREQAEAALEQVNEQLRQVNADMEQFVGAVSHDLKSPLVAAEMLITVLKQALAKQDHDRIVRTSEQISHACKRMRRIIDDLLDHQRAGFAVMKTGPVDMVEIALHVIEEHREQAAQRHAHLHLQDDMPTLRGDRGRLTALLDNLVANALKYGVNGSADPRIDIGCELTEDEIRLFVRDNGPGIPEEDRDRLWGLFQRLSSDEEGSGIGLAIVKRVAEAHGGRVWVECPPASEGGGSIFWVGLPHERLIQGGAV